MILHLQGGQAKRISHYCTDPVRDNSFNWIFFFFFVLFCFTFSSNYISFPFLYCITCSKTFPPKKWIYTDRTQKDQVCVTKDATIVGLKCVLYLSMCSNITNNDKVKMKEAFGPKANLGKCNVITFAGLKPEWQG